MFAKGPFRVPWPDLEHLADQHGLALARTFADDKRLVNGRQFHVGLLAGVVKEVHPTDCADDAASPGVWLAAQKWRGTLATQLLGESSAQTTVLLVQVLFAERLHETGDFLDGLIFGWIDRFSLWHG